MKRPALRRRKAAMLRFEYDDGGRAAAGYVGHTGDCVVRAAAIASGLPYQHVYDLLGDVAAKERPRGAVRSSPDDGVSSRLTIRRLLEAAGGQWHPTMGIGTGTTIHLRGGELPSGRIVARCSGHLVAVIDGVIRDTGDPSRSGSRCVYGYWTFG